MEPSPIVVAPATGTSAAAAKVHPLKVTGRRFGAYLIDAVLLGAIIPVLIFFAVSRPTIFTDSPGCDVAERSSLVPSGQICAEVTGSGGIEGTWVVPTSGIIAAGIYLAAFLVVIEWLVQGATGITVGKLLFGIRTVDAKGTGPGIGKQLIRGVAWIVDGITLCLPVAAWSILVTKRNQRLGDLVAGTFVVHASARGVAVPEAPTGGAAPAPGLDPSGLVPGAFPTAPPTDASAYPANPPIVTPAPPAMAPPDDLTTVHVAASDRTVVQPAVAGASDQDATTTEGPPIVTPAPTTPEPDLPGPNPPEPVAPVASTGPAGDPGGPQWDPARNAYIQWDPAAKTWLVYDDAAAAWKPIS